MKLNSRQLLAGLLVCFGVNLFAASESKAFEEAVLMALTLKNSTTFLWLELHDLDKLPGKTLLGRKIGHGKLFSMQPADTGKLITGCWQLFICTAGPQVTELKQAGEPLLFSFADSCRVASVDGTAMRGGGTWELKLTGTVGKYSFEPTE